MRNSKVGLLCVLMDWNIARTHRDYVTVGNMWMNFEFIFPHCRVSTRHIEQFTGMLYSITRDYREFNCKINKHDTGDGDWHRKSEV